MRALLVGSGSRGDIQPLVALAHGLRSAGHEPVLAAPANFGRWIEAMGFPFIAAGPDLEVALETEGFTGRSAYRFFSATVRAQFGLVAAAREAEVVVGTGVALGASSIAEAAGIPYLFAALSPQWFPSRLHSPPVVFIPVHRRLNRPLWWLTLSLWNLGFRRLVNGERAALGLSPVSDLWAHLLGRGGLRAFDEGFSPMSPDVKTEAVPTGAWLMPEAEELDPELDAWLRAGPPPLYVGFGSMPDLRGRPDRTTELLLRGIEAAGVRALLSSGWAKLGGSDLPATVRRIGPSPHRKLFPRCALIVHHGGAGTTLAAAHAGIPQLLVPHAFDQFTWAEFARSAGVCRQVIRRSALTPERFAAALRESLEDETLPRMARSLKERLTPDGVVLAVRHLEAVARANGRGAAGTGEVSASIRRA